MPLEDGKELLDHIARKRSMAARRPQANVKII